MAKYSIEAEGLWSLLPVRPAQWIGRTVAIYAAMTLGIMVVYIGAWSLSPSLGERGHPKPSQSPINTMRLPDSNFEQTPIASLTGDEVARFDQVDHWQPLQGLLHRAAAAQITPETFGRLVASALGMTVDDWLSAGPIFQATMIKTLKNLSSASVYLSDGQKIGDVVDLWIDAKRATKTLVAAQINITAGNIVNSSDISSDVKRHELVVPISPPFGQRDRFTLSIPQNLFARILPFVLTYDTTYLYRVDNKFIARAQTIYIQ